MTVSLAGFMPGTAARAIGKLVGDCRLKIEYGNNSAFR